MYYGSLDEILIWKESIISINQFTKESNMNSIYSTFGIYRMTNTVNGKSYIGKTV